MSPFTLVSPWPALLLQFALGRLVLSLLPGGRPGGHTPRELFATWGASHVLGQLVVTVQLAASSAAGLELPIWLHLAPWALLLLVRPGMLPGSTPPRHTPLEQGTSPLGWLGRLAAAGAVVLTFLDSGPEDAANLAAICALLLEGMRCLRRRPGDRALLVAALAWTPAVGDALAAGHGPVLSVLTLALVGGVAWLRRADARGLALGASGTLGLAALQPVLTSASLLAALCLVGATARPGRRRAIRFALWACLLLIPTLFLKPSTSGGPPQPSALLDSYLPWTLLGIAGLAAARRRSAVQRPGRELAWLLLLYCAVWVGHALTDSTAWQGLIWGTIPVPYHLLLPICALAASGLLREGACPLVPAPRGALESVLDGHHLEGDYKTTLERLLLKLDEDRADAVMMLLKESRGAWALLLTTPPGRVLFIGNALSGTVNALTSLGWAVVVGDSDQARLRFAQARDRDRAAGQVSHVLLDKPQAPFEDDSFDLVVQEGGPPGLTSDLARLTRDERVLIANNRFAYKRSTGRRGKFVRPGPLAWIFSALLPRSGERSLDGYRRLMGEEARAFALYPHADEFSHVVSLDAALPGLTVGPKERENRAKVLAKDAGLFPLLTPSFAVIAPAKGAQQSSRIDRILDALHERTGEERGELDLLIATRSNAALALTGRGGEPGGWSIHIPLNPSKRKQVEIHARALQDLPQHHPNIPTPTLLFEGTLDGVYLTAERRVEGLNATQITGDSVATAAMFEDTARALASMTTGEPSELGASEFEALITRRVERVMDLCGRRETRRAVQERLEVLSSALIGRVIPRVVYHADLRSKHLQVSPHGRLLGMLDWGTCEDEFLPYVDLLHLVLHQRKQEDGTLPEVAWRSLLADGPRKHERAALDSYSAKLGLGRLVCGAIEEAYPLLVAGMAERNWDYSRPRWLHRQYGI